MFTDFFTWILNGLSNAKLSASKELPTFYRKPEKAPEAEITTDFEPEKEGRLPFVIYPVKKTPLAGVYESKDPRYAHEELQKRFGRFKIDFEGKTGHVLKITQLWRSEEKQADLYEVGRRGISNERRVTWRDGKKRRSAHQGVSPGEPSTAYDVAVLVQGRITWKEKYYDFGELAKKHGLEWTIGDRPHLEYKLPEV